MQLHLFGSVSARASSDSVSQHHAELQWLVHLPWEAAGVLGGEDLEGEGKHLPSHAYLSRPIVVWKDAENRMEEGVGLGEESTSEPGRHFHGWEHGEPGLMRWSEVRL